jgi:hypothetical protein
MSKFSPISNSFTSLFNLIILILPLLVPKSIDPFTLSKHKIVSDSSFPSHVIYLGSVLRSF